MNRRKLLLAILTIIAVTSTLQGAIKAHANTPPPWTASLDAQSTSPTDATIESSYNPHGFVSIGVILNASTTYPVTNVYGWEFGMIYDNTTDKPAGATPSLSVRLGAQSGAGNPNWAGFVTGGNALFVANIVDINPTHQEIVVGFSLIGQQPGVTIGPGLSSSVQGNLLASVNFTVTENTAAASFGLLRRDLIFLDNSSHQLPNAINPGTNIAENQVAFPDFTVSASPSSLTIPQGHSQTSTITVASKGNFNGTISLTTNPPIGITASFNPPTVTPPENGASTSTLNLTISTSTTPGLYTIIVSGNNATLAHTSTIAVQAVAPDFNLTTNANYIRLAPGLHGSLTVTITSVYSFSGNVTLGITGPSPGPAITLIPRTIQILQGTSQAATLNITTTGAAPGNYTFTIQAQGTSSTGGTISHSTSIVVIVTPPGSSLTLLLIFGVIAAVLAVGVATYFMRFRNRPTKKIDPNRSRPNSSRPPRRTMPEATALGER